MADIKHNVEIQAPTNKVYQAIAKQEGVQNWWTLQTRITSEIGGSAEFWFGEEYYIKMEITELLPDSRVGWICRVGDHQWIGTEISFDLEEANNNTLLRFGHQNWESQTEFFGHCNFQWGKYLLSLKNYCENGKGEPFRP